MKHILFALILLSFSITSFADRIPLAVYGVVPQGVSQTTADIVTDIVRMKLRTCGRFDLIEKAKMEEILKEQGFQQTGCTETECAVKMGKVLNVKKMIVGGLGKIGTAYRLSLRVVDVETAVIEAEDAESQMIKEEEMETKLVPPLVDRICPKIGTVQISELPAPSKGPVGGLKVTSEPPGASVFVDGENRGPAPLELAELTEGKHQVFIYKEGFQSVQQEVVVTANTVNNLVSKLKALTNGVRITTSPVGAKVILSGVDRGIASSSGLLISDLPLGEAKVEVSKEGYETYRSVVVVNPGAITEYQIKLVDFPGGLVVTSTPSGAKVNLDGIEKGKTPIIVKDVKMGSHTLKLNMDDFQDATQNVVVEPGKSKAVDVALSKVVPKNEQISVVTPAPSTGAGSSTSEMILIPAGEFIMGSAYDDDPTHTVYLKAYYIDKCEVTVGQFTKFCSATKRNMPLQPEWNKWENYPVVNVSWDDASAFASWAGKRLPTVAEWEKAARGTDGRKYPWGKDWDASKCNSGENSDLYEYTAPVGSFPSGASPYGVMDMAGNVMEWCAGLNNFLCGGSWNDNRNGCRSTYHFKLSLENKDSKFGFRCAR